MTDTALKRRSAAGVPWLPLGPGVTPDAAKPIAWRQSVGWGYSGIEAQTLTATLPLAGGPFEVLDRTVEMEVVER